jgi:general secretion pathway protein K
MSWFTLQNARQSVAGNDRGAALISALLMVALIATLALAVTREMRFALDRAANLDLRDQAHWYTTGARDYAEAMIVRAVAHPDTAFRPDAGWLDEPQVFPIDGGRLAGRIRDAHNCFNLNALVEIDSDGQAIVVPRHRTQLATLLEALGLPAAQAVGIAAQAADWIDSDQRAQASGAEDGDYRRSGRPYRTADTLIAETAELRGLLAMTPEIFDHIAPYLCAVPEARPLALNINTLRLDQAELLMAAFGGALERRQAEALLLQRPLGGFPSEEAFWAVESIQALGLTEDERPRVGLVSRYFEIRIDVGRGDLHYGLEALVRVDPDQGLRRISQTYGVFT